VLGTTTRVGFVFLGERKKERKIGSDILHAYSSKDESKIMPTC
jgi:hypothetical protein